MGPGLLGSVQDREFPNFCGSGIARDWSGIAKSQFLQVRDRTPRLAFIILKGRRLGECDIQLWRKAMRGGRLRATNVVVPMLSQMGRIMLRLLEALEPRLLGCRSGIARDWSGIARIPIFVDLGLLGIGPGLPGSQFL